MQQLTAKDQAVFRSIVKFYETKQYKKGVKAADSILKKSPDHGETLCMKGLTLSYLDKKEEAYELVRKGLKHDLKSHVCWHVFGLLYRQDRDYYEAVRCYKQALRIDAENIQILRDLSLLQIHRRDLTGFAETRRKLLQVKPSSRLNWVGYAIAEHLCKSYEFAWTCIDNYEKTFKDEDIPTYENSELFMYKASIMEEAGKFQEALDCLNKHEKQIVDKVGYNEMKGRLCTFLERFSEAAEIYRKLLRSNEEHHTYALAYMSNQPQFQRFWPPLPAPIPEKPVDQAEEEVGESPVAVPELPSTISSFPQSVHPQGMPTWGWLPPQHTRKARPRVAIGKRLHKRRFEAYEPLCPLTEEEEEAVVQFFDELQSEHPRSDALRLLVLHFITGARFQKKLDAYMRSRLRKGVPALFRMMRPLYFQEGKPQLIEELLLKYNTHLEEEDSWFGPLVGETTESSTEREEEPPSSLLFTRMVTADHFDLQGDTQKALDYANGAIDHTPTLVEIYACKAKIYKRAGDLQESAKWFEEVRQMDLADRFLNTQCVRALLRLDDTQGGMKKALLFSKEPDSPEAANNLHDMQCMWYESAVGRSYWRQRKHGKALKKFNETFKHFSDIAEDQFDFHNYCLRKTTLKAYVAMLRMQERLYSHKFYRRAAKDAIKIYVDIYDMKARGETVGGAAADAEGENAEESAAEKKKKKHKQKREAAKVAEKDNKAAAAPGAKPKKVDDDPEGEKLLEKDPMEEASKLVKTLVMYCTNDAATHVSSYEVFSRQGKLLHCLQALIRLWELAGHDSLAYKLVSPLAHFCFKADLERAEMPDAVRQVILAEMAPILGSVGDPPLQDVAALRGKATKIVDQVEQRMKNDAELPLVEAMYSLKCLKYAGRDIKGFLDSEWKPQGAIALKECNKMLNYLEGEYGKDSSIGQKFKSHCQEAFPLMVIA